MSFAKSLIATAILSLSMPVVSYAGTPGITGTHTGSYDLNVRTTAGALMAVNYKSYSWTWDFDSGIATFDGGYIRSPLSFIPLKYKAHSPINFVDNGDGTYTADYVFQAYNPLYGNPQAPTQTIFEITETSTGLKITTLDGNGDGVAGIPIYGIFPYDIELDWNGVTN